MSKLLEELSWRGFIHDKTPEIEETIKNNSITLYVGFDPTADSLHVGSLVAILMLVHFQKAGHKPLAIIGGATGMIGDPSGKSTERNLLNENILEKNLHAIGKQLSKFLDFEQGKAELVNNYDWMKNTSFLEFARDIGKHITVNYMMAKDSVKKRLAPDSQMEGMSFTEFTYQLLQGNDFLHLYKTKNCVLQIGGSDQWGNITTGIELIRRKLGKKAHGITFPLITKADGEKFGKSQAGENIWLDAKKTSPYKFYQFWLGISDKEAKKFIRIYTFLSKEKIEALEALHNEKPHERLLQKTLAQEITSWVHSKELYEKAQRASEILFGRASLEELNDFEPQVLLDLFEGLPKAYLKKEELEKGIPIVEALVEKSQFISSKAQARRELEAGSVFINKEKITQDFILRPHQLIAKTYIVLQKGKKNYFVFQLT